MSSSQTADIVESVTAKLQDLPKQQQQQVLEFVEFLAQKYVKPKSNQLRVAGLHKLENANQIRKGQIEA